MKKRSSISESISTRHMRNVLSRTHARSPVNDEVEDVTELILDADWLVRNYKRKAWDSDGYYLLYHQHPTGIKYEDSMSETIGLVSYSRQSHDAYIGLVASPAGISDKVVGQAKCVVCKTVAPAEALGFLEMCKWKK